LSSNAVRTISVNLTAGTASFFADLDKAGARIKQFGREGKDAMGNTVSEARAIHSELHAMEGGWLNNTRAAAAFLEKIVGAGAMAQTIFPLFGVAAFAGLLVKAGTEAYKFWKNMEEGAQKAAAAWRDLEAPLRMTNDELAITDQRLKNEIAILEGKHENTAALALLEAKKASDELAHSLDEGLAKLKELLEKQNLAWYNPLNLLKAGTGDLAPMVGRFRTEQADLAERTPAGQYPAAQAELLRREIAEVQKLIDEANAYSAKAVAAHAADETEDLYQDQSERLRQLAKLKADLEAERVRNELTQAVSGDEGTKKKLEEGRREAGEERPYDKSIREQEARIKGLQTELDAVGKNEAGRLLAKAFAEADREIEKVNEALKRINPNFHLTPAQEAKEHTEAQTRVGIEAELEWQNSFRKGTVSIGDRIKSMDLLTDAIGKGYAATRAANVETQLMAEFREHYGDTAWLGQGNHQAEMNARRAQLGTEFDSQHAEKSAQAVYGLSKQIELERELAAAQAQGAEAVRQATLAIRLRQMAAEGATDAQIQAERELFNLQRENTNAEAVAKIDERIAATQRLTAAILQGAAATRQANLENQLAAIAREGDTAIPGIVGIGARGLATTGEEGAAHGEQVAQAAAKTNRVQQIDDEISKLQEAKATQGDTLQLEIQLRDLENQRLKALADMSLAMRSARDGVRAFFIEMQEDSKSAAQIMADALNSVLDQTSSNLAKLLTGHKTDWAKQFQQEGEQMVQASTKSLLQTGLGKLGGLFGVDIGGKKPDGTALDPIWVRLVDAGLPGGMGAPAASMAGIPAPLGTAAPAAGGGWLSAIGRLFGFNPSGGSGGGGGGGGTPDVSSSISFPGMASGGDIEPGQPYMVGEHGPELRVFATGGSIVPNEALAGGVHNEYHIDARGADLGAYNRIARGIEAAHKDAVATAVQVMHQRAHRVPSGRRG
jgi:hypothetical protein